MKQVETRLTDKKNSHLLLVLPNSRAQITFIPGRRSLLYEEGNKRRTTPATWPTFPTVNKAINFISGAETHPDRYPATPGEYNSSCRVIRADIYGRARTMGF